MSTTTTTRRPALGAALATATVAALVGATILSMVFGWPDVLAEPGTVALVRFAEHEAAIRAGFYLLLLSSVLLGAAAVGLYRVLTPDTGAARVFTALGIAGAMFQVLGWVRWPVTVPGLAERYADPGASDAARTATAAAYDLVNTYAGAALGEHLGWLLQGPWAVAVGVYAFRATGLPRWFGGLGLASAAVWAPLLVIGVPVEALADGAAEAVGNAAYTVWFVWVGALGVLLATRRVEPAGLGPRAR